MEKKNEKNEIKNDDWWVKWANLVNQISEPS